MLDGVTLDQLRTFIAAAEQGSFSAAGRKLRRAQSVVSQTLANLEAQLGVQLFDRRNRFPALTTEGQALLREARAYVQATGGLFDPAILADLERAGYDKSMDEVRRAGAGRSVNCRYGKRNRREILESRVNSVRAIRLALEKTKHPPPVWLQAATATIYVYW